MALITFRDVTYQNSKKLCDCLIEKGMNMEQAFEVVCKLIKGVKGSVNLDKVKIGKLNIKTDCLKENMLTTILNELIAADAAILLTVAGFQQTLTNINGSIGALKDEKVKVSGAVDPLNTAGYLIDKLKTNQPGSITITDQFTILFTGFVPIGAQMMINKNRLTDFDASGKGKVNTDLYGYAISNGNNGTTNRLGKFSKYVNAALDTPGNTGGVAKLALTSQHIPGFSMPVTGSIGEALTEDKKFKIGWIHHRSFDGKDGADQPIKDEKGNANDAEWFTPPYSFKHSHTFNLTAKRTNDTPTEIDINPEHILEIPIERITI